MIPLQEIPKRLANGKPLLFSSPVEAAYDLCHLSAIMDTALKIFSFTETYKKGYEQTKTP